MTQNRPVRTPVALAVLNLLAEREMHPYEMRRVMSERGHEWIIKFRGGLVYHTIQRLHEGHALNIYPEGSRTQDGNLLPIEKGVALVLRRAKVPIVPAVIDGAFQAWPKGRKFPRPASLPSTTTSIAAESTRAKRLCVRPT